MAKRSKSSQAWLEEHHNDEYVKRAQKEGWRSRAIYKLEEIDRAEGLLRPGGAFVAKMFQGAGFQEFVRDIRPHFAQVKLKKPRASRARSPEVYLLASGRRMV